MISFAQRATLSSPIQNNALLNDDVNFPVPVQSRSKLCATMELSIQRAEELRSDRNVGGLETGGGYQPLKAYLRSRLPAANSTTRPHGCMRARLCDLSHVHV